MAKVRYTFSKEEIDRFMKWGNITPNGVVYQDELVSIDGVQIFLIKTKDITDKQIAEAKRHLRNERDVVRFYTAYPEREEI